MEKKSPVLILFAIFFFLFSFFNSPLSRAQSAGQIEILFDASGSMNEASGGTTKLDAAKQALATVAGQIAQNSNVGLRMFGTTPIQGNISESCTDSILALPIGPFQKDTMVSKVLPIKSYGMTALGYSLEQAAKDFTPGGEVKKTIILISDGEEPCGKDPIAVMNDLKAQGINIPIHAVGFAATDAAKAQLKKLAEVTQGSYREAQDAAELQKSLQEVANKELLLTAQKNESGPNILSAAEGARIVSSSTQEFAKMIDGNDDESSQGHAYPGEEAVFSFKDNQTVLLEKFAVPVFAVNSYNPGQFKLSGSLESPEDGFTPIAEFTVANKVYFGNVYQGFKIEPPTAVRYLKVTVGPGSGQSHSYHREWKAYGKYLTEAEAADALKKQGAREFNILAQEYGGQLIAASDMKFKNLIDGRGGGEGASAESITPNQEGIFGFKGGKSALITKVEVPIFEARQDNCKTLQFSVSETSPTGPYTKVGTFQTTNMVFAGSPYQEYAFEKPVKAKYLKMTVLETWGNWSCHMAELHAFGKIEE